MDIETIVAQSILKNIIEIDGKKYVTAGAHQFRTLWTRDFCFSVSGLLNLNLQEIVKNQLQLIIDHTNENGLVPLYCDSMSPMKRVFLSSIGALFKFRIQLKIQSPLKAYYKINGKYPNIDSNILTLKAVLEYCAKTQDIEFFLKNETKLVSIYKYYDQFLKDGLIHQGPFADWKDSARREGAIFLTNMLYSNVTEELCLFSQFNFCQERAPFLRRAIEAGFKDPQTGLFQSEFKRNQFGLDDQLLAIKWNWVKGDQKKELWNALIKHPLWTSSQGPLIATYPRYKSGELISHVKWAGLKAYHDEMTWSWLTGLAFKVALMMNDTQQAQNILKISDQLFGKQQFVSEVYDPKSRKPYSSWLYQSEEPFLWGAASYAEAFEFLKNLKSLLGLK